MTLMIYVAVDSVCKLLLISHREQVRKQNRGRRREREEFSAQSRPLPKIISCTQQGHTTWPIFVQINENEFNTHLSSRSEQIFAVVVFFNNFILISKERGWFHVRHLAVIT